MDADLPLPPPAHAGTLPRIVAVLVVRDGAEWLGNVLATVAAQRYPALDLVVVDNASTDGSPAILARRIPPERLITLPRPVGFGRAVAVALQSEAFDAAEVAFLLHDDLALAPDALNRLATALRQDPSLGIVGPKLREWGEEPVLQEVGMTIDRLGRAESLLEPRERDQGQHDTDRDVLYVSSAAMLIRLDVLRGLGGFDPRFPALRDDLDLCWRAWLAGWRVGVVPGAVGYHVAAASRFARPVGSGRVGGLHSEARYLAERHTLATLLKNYSALRLLWVLPVVWLLGIAKVVGFLATRRFSHALAVVRAWLWNIAQLPSTLRRRRFVQSRREASDADVGRLFASGLPRIRTYAEALGNWLAGGSTRALIDEADREADEEVTEGRALARAIRDHPVASVGLALLAVFLVGVAPLLGAGQLVGGEVAPWPAEAADFLRVYAAPWNGEPLASAAFPSPIQGVLGLVSMLGLGSVWLAQRVVVLGLVPLAWLLAVRAGRLVSDWPLPRILGATAYALSPAVLGALSSGRFAHLVAAALAPGMVHLAARTVDPATTLKTAWRAAALLGLLMAIVVGASLRLGTLVLAGWVAAVVVGARAGRPAVRRLLVAGGAAILLLAPWLVGLVQEGYWPVPADAEPLALWRALGVVPATLQGLDGAGAWLLGAATAAVVLGAVLLGVSRRPGIVAGLAAAVVVAGLGAWALSRWPQPVIDAETLLVVAAGALAGLVVVGARWFVDGLGHLAFGARQLVVVVAAVMFALGLGSGVLRLAGAPWSALERGTEVVPAFVAAETVRVGPYRVLRLAEAEGEVRWEVLRAQGPSMLTYGTTPSRTLREFIGDAVVGAVGGADSRAGARLGVANIRYVVADVGELRQLLARQPALDPLPAGGGRVFRVQTWLPRAAVIPADIAEVLGAGRDPGTLRQFEERGLDVLRPGVYSGNTEEGGALVLSEARHGRWHATIRGVQAERRDLLAVNAFTVPEPGRVGVRFAGGPAHRTIVSFQVLLGLGLLSLALRPPGTTLQRAEAGQLPMDLAVPEEVTT